jgi:sulfate adenylyltransferase subunit 2
MLMDDLINKSIYIIREANANFKHIGVLWSTGKDSTTMLSLIKDSFYDTIPFPVIHIDTGYKFKQIYEFRDRIAKEWNFNLIVCENKEAKMKNINPYSSSKMECCTLLKTEALKQLLERERFDALIVSIRWDEHGIRGKERYMSPRDKEFKWNIVKDKGEDIPESGQDAELAGWNLFATDFGPNTNHVRIHPILHWSEIDCWRYIKLRNLPFNPLYFEGYRSLGCYPCTKPMNPPAKDIDEIIKRLEETHSPERAGRAQDKEDSFIMQRLRALGYP